ncbi:hypothetical protein [Streptomyces nigrescens]|uniref:hypothetical protein n=1 Tax=Streptomyces nigrescens TaxID=1920 RepID=UPI0036D0C2D3
MHRRHDITTATWIAWVAAVSLKKGTDGVQRITVTVEECPAALRTIATERASELHRDERDSHRG